MNNHATLYRPLDGLLIYA